MPISKILTSSYATLDATKLSGNLPAISGASLTGITENYDGWKLIRDTAISTGDSYITLTGLFSDTYENYVINFMGLQPSTACYVLMNVVTGSSDVLTTASYEYAGYGQQDDNTKVESYSNGGQDKIYIQPTVHRSDEHMNFTMWYSRPKGVGSNRPILHWKGGYVQNTSYKRTTWHGMAHVDTTTELTGFKLHLSASATFNDLQIQVLGGKT